MIVSNQLTKEKAMKKHNKQHFTALVLLVFYRVACQQHKPQKSVITRAVFTISETSLCREIRLLRCALQLRYTTNRLNNGSGEQINSVTFNNPTGVVTQHWG